VNRDGNVVWSLSLPETESVYDVERLGQPDESTGVSASTLDIPSTAATARRNLAFVGGDGRFRLWDVVLSPFVNSLLFVLPGWLGAHNITPVFIGVAVVLVWEATEAYRLREQCPLRWPVVRE